MLRCSAGCIRSCPIEWLGRIVFCAFYAPALTAWGRDSCVKIVAELDVSAVVQDPVDDGDCHLAAAEYRFQPRIRHTRRWLSMLWWQDARFPELLPACDVGSVLVKARCRGSLDKFLMDASGARFAFRDEFDCASFGVIGSLDHNRFLRRGIVFP